MKKFAARFLVVFCFVSSLCFSLTVSAARTNHKHYTIENVNQLTQYLLGQTSSLSTYFDADSDGIINAVDLTIMKRIIMEANSAKETTTVATTTTATTVSDESYDSDTTTAKSTSNFEEETTTTESQTTETTTETTSVSREPEETMKRDGYVYLKNGLDHAAKTTITVPNYNSDLYEVKNATFLFEKDDISYAYSILCEKNAPLYELFSDPALIKGVHVWKYEGDEVPTSIYDELPDTTGKTFTMADENYEGQIFEYNLRSFSSINYGDVVMVSELIHPKRHLYPSDIACYDYSLNGVLDADDVQIMTKYAVAKLFNLFDDCNQETFYRFFDKMSVLGNTNMVFLKTDLNEPIPYAYNIPSADIILDPNETDADREGLEYAKVPVQILPKSFAKQLAEYSEMTELSDKTADYYAWFKEEQKWAKVATDSKIWRFQSGFNVFILDDDGNHVLEWIK